MIRLLKDYDELTPQMKENMAECLRQMGWSAAFKDYARFDQESARTGLNSIMQIGDFPLKIVPTDEDIPKLGKIKEYQRIDPNFNPNEKDN